MSAPPAVGAENLPARGEQPNMGARLAGIAWILLVAAAAITLEQPRRTVPASAPASQFSAERAMQQVREIARAPHPVGSGEHARVRDYLLAQLEALGLEPTVQKTTSFVAAFGTAATVENILARKAGRATGPEDAARKALLLVAHYDSVPAGPGAGDDGAGVATLLETAKALGAGPPLRNDVIFLFTDGEELGLLGATAFVAGHPWKSRVGAVLNLDNRGTSGPVVMYETSPGNLPLMREFASVVPSPRAVSLAGAVAQLLPNSSDFFVFRNAGLPGLNFAFIDGPENYHTPQDTPARLDPRTLQQSGDNLLPLAWRLANADLSALAARGAPDAVYFNVGDWEVVYPQSWARPLATGAALLFLLVVATGMSRGARPGMIVLCVVLCLVSVIAAWRIGDWLAMSLSRSAGGNPFGGVSGAYFFHPLYPVALYFLVAGLTFALWELSGAQWTELSLAGTFVWCLLGLALAFRLPGASYLGIWPLVFMLMALGCVLGWRGCPRAVAAALVWLGAAPAIVLLAPLVPALHLALGMSTPGAAGLGILAVLALWLMAPLLSPKGEERPRLPFFCLAAGAACIAVGAWTVRYDARHPRPESMAYVLDGDHSVAYWMSRAEGQAAKPERPLDPWRRQYLTDQPEFTPFPVTLGLRGPTLCWAHRVLALDISPPTATLLEETRENGMRTLRIRIASPRRAARFSLTAKASQIGAIRLNGHDVGEPLPGGKGTARASLRVADQRDSWSVLYAAPPEDGVEATFVVPVGEPLDLTVADISDGLPDVPGQLFAPRPADITQQHFADGTVVFRRFAF